MKKVLFVYREMMMGGSTTSFLSILNEIDYTKYSVDVLLLQHGMSELVQEIPKQVNLLPCAYRSALSLKLRKRLSWKCWKAYLMGYSPRQREQVIAQAMASFCGDLEDEYDIAAGFLECWPLYFVANHVRASRKVNWIHVNYGKAGFDPALDKKFVDKIDSFALVSNSCKEDFINQFDGKEKTFVIPNILSSKTIRNKAELAVYDVPFDRYADRIKFVSVCRLDCKHKGLDRAISAFSELKKKYDNLADYVWFIIGDGDDFAYLEHLISKFNLNEQIILLGQKHNPHPYVKQCDVFLLPSHYEGKPMAVTEAQMLGVVPCVTNYSSAKEQVTHMVDGLIVDNLEEAIEEMLRKILANEVDIEKMHQITLSKDYSNLKDMDLVMRLLEGEN